jgi:hypothetical protein
MADANKIDEAHILPIFLEATCEAGPTPNGNFFLKGIAMGGFVHPSRVFSETEKFSAQ